MGKERKIIIQFNFSVSIRPVRYSYFVFVAINTTEKVQILLCVTKRNVSESLFIYLVLPSALLSRADICCVISSGRNELEEKGKKI